MSPLLAFATPSSVFWTNCTTDVQPYGTLHFGVDNYFSVGNRTKNGSSFPVDIGLEGGLFSCYGISSEGGVDYLGGVSDPLLFNGKVGVEEGKLFTNAPSFSIGVFDIGTTRATNFSVVDAVIGHTLPQNIGTLYLGVYKGKRALGNRRSGWMVAYQKSFCNCSDAKGTSYAKWQLCADYASGKNAIGGGGFGVTYAFTQAISILTGPVWFTDTRQNGRWKWSLQLDITLP
jgi:hypothetical protein